jgi:hypothetical protein
MNVAESKQQETASLAIKYRNTVMSVALHFKQVTTNIASAQKTVGCILPERRASANGKSNSKQSFLTERRL